MESCVRARRRRMTSRAESKTHHSIGRLGVLGHRHTELAIRLAPQAFIPSWLLSLSTSTVMCAV
jgi:hypothetical protein